MKMNGPLEPIPAFPLRRRALLKLGGFVAVSPWPAAVMAANSVGAELFAFSAAGGTLVFAVTMVASAANYAVRIHAGGKVWVIDGREQTFVGMVRKADETHRLFLAAVQAASLRSGDLRVWAEVSGTDGSRWRVGNPVIKRDALVDALPFDPALTPGFTFAGQNGRRPAERIGDVVATIRAGTVSPCPTTAFRASAIFPYFQGAVTA